MASVNRATILGNLGRDPELKYLESGTAVCNFTVATNEKWKDKAGEAQERTEWHRITCWAKTAENCAQYLSKGDPVYIEGKIQTRDWEDKDGNKRQTTEIIAQFVQFLKQRGGGSGGSSPSDDPPPPTNDDVPF